MIKKRRFTSVVVAGIAFQAGSVLAICACFLAMQKQVWRRPFQARSVASQRAEHQINSSQGQADTSGRFVPEMYF